MTARQYRLHEAIVDLGLGKLVSNVQLEAGVYGNMNLQEICVGKTCILVISTSYNAYAFMKQKGSPSILARSTIYVLTASG